jgi:MoaA/NifB/PqqE/SkfB family radical SAM enzyme
MEQPKEGSRYGKMRILVTPAPPSGHGHPGTRDTDIVGGWRAGWVRFRVRLHLLWLALLHYGSPVHAIRAILHFYDLRARVFGRRGSRRIVHHDGRYYFALYVPGYPSSQFDQYVLHEMNHAVKLKKAPYAHTLIHLAMTCKCPLRCEHCFEWDNLNHPEPFTGEQLLEVMKRYQSEGVCSIHFTGGEPMVRFRELERMMIGGGPASEYWVLSSGFNVTEENTRRLKQAGATGMIISLDHYEAKEHDRFRGYQGAFEMATGALRTAKDAGLLTAVSICVTRAFANDHDLERYASLAKQLGASFIQLLDPRAVGHYEGMPVCLGKKETEIMDAFLLRVNYEPAYKDHPLIIYHGYYQRHSGCLSGGGRSLYVDSAGGVHACPFCHTSEYNIRDILDNGMAIPRTVSSCPVYREF